MSKEETTRENSALFDVGTIMILLVPLLYTAGWSYAFHYFDHFHLGLLGLDIPYEYFFLYSFWTIKDQYLLSLAALLALVIVYFIIRLLHRRATSSAKPRGKRKGAPKPDSKQDFSQAIGLLLAPVVILSLFLLFYHMGDRAAKSSFETQAKGAFPSYPRVKVWLADAESKSDGEEKEEAIAISREWEEGCYRLLLRNKDNLYLFYPGSPGDKIPTEIVPTGKVRFVRVLPHYRSCPE